MATVNSLPEWPTNCYPQKICVLACHLPLTIFTKMYSFCLNFALPRPTRRAQVQSKKTTLEKRQFIHVLKALKQGLKVQEKDDF